MIAAEPLSYTEHPALVARKKAPMCAAPAAAFAAGSGVQGAGLAIAAGAALAVVGVAAVLDTQKLSSQLLPSVPSNGAVFEARPAAESRPVVPEAVASAPSGSYSLPASARMTAAAEAAAAGSSSARGIGAVRGAAAGSTAGAAAQGAGRWAAAAGVSSPAPLMGAGVASVDPSAVADPAAGAAGGGLQMNALTSFDGTMTLTAGGLKPVAGAAGQMGCGAACAPQQQPAALPEPAPAREPVVWNRPLNWIRVHDLGGAQLAGSDPRVPN